MSHPNPHDCWLVGADGVYAGSPASGWSRVGRFDFHVNALLADGARVLAGVGCGLWEVDLADGAWKQLHDETVTEVLALAPSRRVPGVLAGCPYGIASGAGVELGAVRWRFHSDAQRVNERYTNVLIRVRDGMYLAGTEAGVLVFEEATGRLVHTSLAGFPVRCAIAVGARLLAGSDGHGVWSSGDAVSWVPQGSGIDDQTVLALAWDGEALVAGTDRGVLVSRPDGSWRRCGPAALVAAVAADPSGSGRWLIGCRPAGLWWTQDAGATWRQSGAFVSVGAVVAPNGASGTGRRAG